MKQYIILLILLVSGVLTAAPAFAQKSGTKHTVTGKVTDQSGEPLIGATVLVTGTTNGASTNATGDYSIQVPEGASLTFQYIGYEAKTEKGGGISRTPARRWPMIAAAYAAIHLFIYWVLVTFTNSTVPFWDSLTTSLSIVGMWMLSRKYLEQWFVWFVVNLVTVGLYFYKEIPLTALLYTIYLTMSLAGYFRWRRMMRRQMRG